MDFSPAPPDVLAVVGALITRHFSHLATARIAVLVRAEPIAADETGEPVGTDMVTVAAMGASEDASDPFDYVMWFAWSVWQLLDAQQREAIVFHELMHAGRDEQGRPTLMPHDASVFNEEVKLYGVWWESARQKFKAARKGEG